MALSNTPVDCDFLPDFWEVVCFDFLDCSRVLVVLAFSLLIFLPALSPAACLLLLDGFLDFLTFSS